MKNILRRISAGTHAFLRRDGGQVAIITALTLPVLVLGIGGAMDYSRVLAAKSKLQAATDSAALATYRHYASNPGLTIAQLKTHFHTYLQTALRSKFEQAITIKSYNVTFAGSNKNKLVARVQADFPTTFIRLAGIPQMEMGALAEVQASQNRTEVALVLDVTGSMRGAKIAELKRAATQFLEKIHARLPGDKESFKVAIVPFAQYVNVGKKYRGAWWLKDASDRNYSHLWRSCTRPCEAYKKKVVNVCWNEKIGVTSGEDARPIFRRVCADKLRNVCVRRGPEVCTTRTFRRKIPWDGCVGSREEPFNVKDENYRSRKVPAVLRYQRDLRYPLTNHHAFNDKKNKCPPPLTPLMTLKDNKSTLVRKINRLNANGLTYIPAGLMWGWRVLSDKAPFSEGANDEEVVKKNVQKVIILMTDGVNTVAPRTDGYFREHLKSKHAEARANAYTRQVCNNIKAINPATGRPYADIITITFDVKDSGIKALMKDCASLGSFDAASGELTKVFSNIADRLADLHLSK